MVGKPQRSMKLWDNCCPSQGPLLLVKRSVKLWDNCCPLQGLLQLMKRTVKLWDNCCPLQGPLLLVKRIWTSELRLASDRDQNRKPTPCGAEKTIESEPKSQISAPPPPPYTPGLSERMPEEERKKRLPGCVHKTASLLAVHRLTATTRRMVDWFLP